MEVVQLVGKDSQGLCQRVFIEIVRRKATVEASVMGKKDNRVVMILGIDNFLDRDNILYALKAIPDVISAEWIEGRVKCDWEAMSHDGHSLDIVKSME
jgi:hypothetical protein